MCRVLLSGLTLDSNALADVPTVDTDTAEELERARPLGGGARDGTSEPRRDGVDPEAMIPFASRAPFVRPFDRVKS